LLSVHSFTFKFAFFDVSKREDFQLSINQKFMKFGQAHEQLWASEIGLVSSILAVFGSLSHPFRSSSLHSSCNFV
jgi:hypothetical protein